MFVGYVTLEATLYFPVLTDDASVPEDADAAPTWIAYSVNIASALTNGTTADLSGVDGAYIASIACTAANGFAAGNLYTVLVSYAMGASARRQSFTFMVT